MPQYVVELHFEAGGRVYRSVPSTWHVRAPKDGLAFGQPTDDNLRRLITAFEASTYPGGVHEALGPACVIQAEIRRDDTPVVTYSKSDPKQLVHLLQASVRAIEESQKQQRGS